MGTSTHPNADHSLVDAWKSRRDAESLQRIIEKYTGLVYGTALRVLRNHHDAEEITQESFIKLAEKPPIGEGVAPWLHRVAYNTALNRIRGEERRRTRENIAIERDAASPPNESINDDTMRLVDQALADLPEDIRTPLWSHYYEDESHQSIATRLGLSRSAVTRRIDRGVKRMGAQLQEKGIDINDLTLSRFLVFAIDLPNVDSSKLPEPTTITANAMEAIEKPVSASLWLPSKPLLLLGAMGVAVIALTIAFQNPTSTPSPANTATTTQEDVDAARTTEAQLTQASAANPASADLQSEQDTSNAQVASNATVTEPSTAQEILQRMLQVNKAWLSPSVEYLHYEFGYGGEAPPGEPTKVWVAGNEGRVKLGYAEFVFNGSTFVVLNPRDQLLASPHHWPRHDKTFRQGIMMHTAVHALHENGIPKNAKIVNRETTEEGELVSIEFDLGAAEGEFGKMLGYFRSNCSVYEFGKVRLTVQIPEYIPVKEQIIGKNTNEPHESYFTFSPNFIEFAGGLAPTRVQRHHTIGKRDEETKRLTGEWLPYIMNYDFQVIDEVWMFSKLHSYTDGVPADSWLETRNITTEPFDKEIVRMPIADELVALQSTYEPAEFLGDNEHDRPQVVSVFPKLATENLPEQLDLRIAFDRPMNPTQGKFFFLRGGFENVEALKYDADTYEFTIPIRLKPGRHQIVINSKDGDRPEGFRSETGLAAQSFRWGFEVASPIASSPTGAPAKVLNIAPLGATPLSCFSRIVLHFDKPIDPESPWRVWWKKRSYQDHVALRALATYDEEEHQLTIPIVLPPNHNIELTVDGILDTNGVAVAPATLSVRTKKQLFRASEKGDLQDAELQTLLTSIAAAQQQTTSATERITRLETRSEEGIYNMMNTCQVTFAFDQGGRVAGDVSGIMNSDFQVGTDGTNAWKYYRSYDPRRLNEGLEVAPINGQMNQVLSFIDNFSLSTKSPQEAIEDLRLKYMGIEEIYGKPCHVIGALLGSMQSDMAFVRDERWYIDVSTLLPVAHTSQSDSNKTTWRYEFDYVNQPVPERFFLPPNVPDEVIKPPMPLKPGYDKRFIQVMDGTNGHMSLRWGIQGEAGRESGGLN